MWPNPQETRKSPSGKLYFLYSMNVGPDSSWLAKWVLQWLKLTFSFRNDGKSINSIQPILYQCSISITSENVRELSVFSRFQGLWIWYIGIKWVSFNSNTAQKMKKSLMKNFIFCAVKFVPTIPAPVYSTPQENFGPLISLVNLATPLLSIFHRSCDKLSAEWLIQGGVFRTLSTIHASMWKVSIIHVLKGSK